MRRRSALLNSKRFREFEFISDITKTSSNNCLFEDRGHIITTVLLCIILKKITTKTPSHATQFEVALGNHALRAQPTDPINLLPTGPFCHARLPVADQKDRGLSKPHWSDIC